MDCCTAKILEADDALHIQVKNSSDIVMFVCAVLLILKQ